MIVKLQYERGQECLKMMTRFDIYLWMIVSSLEDGISDKNTLLMRVVLALTG